MCDSNEQQLRALCRTIAEKHGFTTQLRVGGIFPHPTRKGVKVKIIDGQGWVEAVPGGNRGGWSNFWSWRVVRPGGKFGRLEHGYGWM